MKRTGCHRIGDIAKLVVKVKGKVKVKVRLKGKVKARVRVKGKIKFRVRVRVRVGVKGYRVRVRVTKRTWKTSQDKPKTFLFPSWYLTKWRGIRLRATVKLVVLGLRVR